MKLGADFLAEDVDGHEVVALLEMPEGPTVTSGSPLDERTDFMDRSTVIFGDEGGVGPDLGIPTITRAAK